MISTFINFFLSYLLLYKYATIFLISYFAALIAPLPSNTTLFASSAFASQGYLSIYNIFLVAYSASVLGDITGFLLSRSYGKRVLMRTPLRTILTSSKYIKMEDLFENNTGKTIFITRSFSGVGPLVNVLAGFSDKISFKKFLVYDMLGQLTYISFFTLTGYYLGDTWLELLSPIEIFWIVVGAIVVIGIATVLFRSGTKNG